MGITMLSDTTFVHGMKQHRSWSTLLMLNEEGKNKHNRLKYVVRISF